MSDHSIIAAADQAHAEAEHTLNELIEWWAENRGTHTLSRSDEVAVLTFILGNHTSYGALLATAINRLADKDTP